MPEKRIVIIDDNRSDAHLVGRFLERAGYRVSYAGDGTEGIRTVGEVFPDCVLVDYRMPGMDGYEVCRRLKAAPAMQNIPVLMLTGADSARHVVEGLDSGADDFVTKSSDMEVLVARVRALLRVKDFQDRIVEQAEQLRQLYEEIKAKSDKIMALNQKLHKDLEIARLVQESLLPDRSMTTSRAEIRSAYIPSETLSGDFYDYYESGNALYLFIADVSGHGLAAAILVSLLKSYIRSETTEAPRLGPLMRDLNDFLFSASLPSQYATAQLFHYVHDSGELRVSTAAHPPFLLVRSGTAPTEIHERPGHMLGAIAGLDFEDTTLVVGAGDLLFAYTDGLTDRRNDAGEFYSIERIARILEANRTEDIDDLCERVLADTREFAATEELRDDIAFVLTRFR
ncbi:MAG: fused response regulator/phosphatase [Thermoanaerobaculia bacterium]